MGRRLVRDPPAGAGGRNPWKDFRGERRSNATHVSTTDPEALLARKGEGQAAKLSFAGHVLMENRNGLMVDVVLSQATGTAETEAALTMLERVPTARRITVGADKTLGPATVGWAVPFTRDERRSQEASNGMWSCSSAAASLTEART